MSLPLFKDFNKPAKDFLSKNFPTTNKTTLKTAAENGVSFEVSAENKGGAYFGTFKPKLVLDKYDTEFAGEFTSDNLFKGDVTVKDLLPGLTTKFHGETGDGKDGARDKAEIDLTYKHESATVNAVATMDIPKQAPTVKLSTVLGFGDFSGGAAATLNLSEEFGPSDVSAGLGYKTGGYNITALANGKLADSAWNLSGNVLYKVDNDLSVAAQVNYDLGKGADGISGTIAGKYSLDASSSVKAKFTNGGALTLAYSNKVNKYSTLEIGTEIDTLGAGAGKFGAHLTVG